MKIKRYIVETMPSAMQQIRADLGNDAVILSTKDLYVGGFLGMFRKKRIEVVAAVDKTSTPTKSSESRPVRAVPPSQPRTAEAQEAAVASLIAAASSTPRMSTAATAYRTAQNQHDPVDAQQQSQPESQMRRPSEPIVTDSTSPREPIPSLMKNQTTSREDQIFDELRQVRETLAKLSQRSGNNDEDEFAQPILALLDEQDINADIFTQWLEQYKELTDLNDEERSADHFGSFVKDQMRTLIQEMAPEGIRSTTHVVYVAGPTGVGKTTTIAKLAAEQLFRHQRKVGFITSDTYRIAAVEQLRTYATILNIPLEVVNSPADFMRAMKSLEHCDLIFMDTAGRNFRNELLVSELNSLLKPMDSSETYVVLSLTSKYRDMAKIVGHFQKYQLDKVIFTKMDETASMGAIINVIHDYHLKLSYITNGQNVPEDIAIIDPEQLVQRILGEHTNG
ncbi:flagellar biosynthesis protein FlhF [Paenibacillus selenitireducens]|uniref:Flagellar biosynthesis protein FlhF n=1 Tax=Paenibacillus selenitireducens TaxID=1324314 RepID=A0A1T2XCJ5_9BACL|nr:flagellar biosynthesis protein FlhF [Paenibacillus selenitireducens]OPA77611.1 flagellar biosynthesis protein FlhF [Paenibacillus selenitireducens]